MSSEWAIFRQICDVSGTAKPAQVFHANKNDVVGSVANCDGYSADSVFSLFVRLAQPCTCLDTLLGDVLVLSVVSAARRK